MTGPVENPTVLVERRGPVTVITLNRPERRNAVDLATAVLLEQTVDAFEADPDALVAAAPPWPRCAAQQVPCCRR